MNGCGMHGLMNGNEIQKNSYQRLFKPSRNFIIPNKSRYKDVICNRLRLLQSNLNAGLHKINLHPNGFCVKCGVEESNTHFLLDCLNTTELRREIKRKCSTPVILSNYQELTSNQRVLETILEYVTLKN